jgi:hypothetical protein
VSTHYENDDREEYQTDSENAKKFWSHDGVSGCVKCESGRDGCCIKVLRERKRRGEEAEAEEEVDEER